MVEALVMSIGGSNQSAKVMQTVLGKTVGRITLGLGVYDAVMGIVDGDVTQEDMLDVLEALAGVGMILSGGWLAVGYGVVSLGIAIYQTSDTPNCD